MRWGVVALVPLVVVAQPLPPPTSVPREAWVGNYSSSWASQKTIVTLGPGPNSITASNRVQPWSPAHGVINGSSVTMTFGKDVLHGRFRSSGYIQWENDSRWLKDGSMASKMVATMMAKHQQPEPVQKTSSATSHESYESYESYETYDSDSYSTYSYTYDSDSTMDDGSYDTYSYSTYSYEDEPKHKAGPPSSIASALTLMSKGSKGSSTRPSAPSTKAPPSTKPPQGRAPPMYPTATLSGAGRVKSAKPNPGRRRALRRVRDVGAVHRS